MKRTFFVLMIALLLPMALVIHVCAESAHMIDDANLLFSSETAALEATLSDISDRYDVDVVILAVHDTDGKDPMDFADDFYDYGGYRSDGILLLVSMEERDWWVSTAGYGITAFTDAGLQYMSDRFVPYLSDGDYEEAFTEFAQLCDTFLAQAKTGDPYDSHNLPKDPFNFVTSLIIAVIVGLLAAWIATGVMKSKLKSVRQQTKADDYICPGSFRLTHSRDLFLYTHIDRRERPKNSGSSTHTSSSGTTHGGGGGKF